MKAFHFRQPSIHVVSSILLLVALTPHQRTYAQASNRITVLYDAFGARTPALEMDWGFAALLEYGGRRILFDTGNNRDIFARNAKRLGVDLTRLDAVVISHRHGDHTSGLAHVVDMAPGVKIYAPGEGAFFIQRFKNRFDRAGLGAEIPLP